MPCLAMTHTNAVCFVDHSPTVLLCRCSRVSSEYDRSGQFPPPQGRLSLQEDTRPPPDAGTGYQRRRSLQVAPNLLRTESCMGVPPTPKQRVSTRSVPEFPPPLQPWIILMQSQCISGYSMCA